MTALVFTSFNGKVQTAVYHAPASEPALGQELGRVDLADDEVRLPINRLKSRYAVNFLAAKARLAC